MTFGRRGFRAARAEAALRAAGGRRVDRATGDGVPGGDGAGRVPARRQAICMCPIHCIAAGRLSAWSNPRARLISVVYVAPRVSPPDERATPWKVHDAALSNAAISGCPVRHGVAADLVDPWLSSDGDAHAVGRRMRAQETLTRQEIDDKGGFWNIGGKQLAVTDPAAPHRDADAPEEAPSGEAPRGEGRRTPEGHDQPLVVGLIAPLGDGGTHRLRYRPALLRRVPRGPDRPVHPLRGTPHALRGLPARRPAGTTRVRLRLRLEAHAGHRPAPRPRQRPAGPRNHRKGVNPGRGRRVPLPGPPPTGGSHPDPQASAGGFRMSGWACQEPCPDRYYASHGSR